jgi:hypothetical protein
MSTPKKRSTMKKTITLILAIFAAVNISNAQSFLQKGSDIDGEADYDQSGISVSMPDNQYRCHRSVRK